MCLLMEKNSVLIHIRGLMAGLFRDYFRGGFSPPSEFCGSERETGESFSEARNVWRTCCVPKLFRMSKQMSFSCHIRHLTKCPNWCRTWNICFLLIFSWKMLQPNFAFWDIFMLLRCLNSKEIKLQNSIRVICIIFDLIFFQLKIKIITNIPSSTTISTLRQASNMTWKAHWSYLHL